MYHISYCPWNFWQGWEIKTNNCMICKADNCLQGTSKCYSDSENRKVTAGGNGWLHWEKSMRRDGSEKILKEWLGCLQADKERGTLWENENNTWTPEVTHFVHEEGENQTRMSPEDMLWVSGKKNGERPEPKEDHTAPSVRSSPFLLVVSWDGDLIL